MDGLPSLKRSIDASGNEVIELQLISDLILLNPRDSEIVLQKLCEVIPLIRKSLNFLPSESRDSFLELFRKFSVVRAVDVLVMSPFRSVICQILNLTRVVKKSPPIKTRNYLIGKNICLN